MIDDVYVPSLSIYHLKRNMTVVSLVINRTGDLSYFGGMLHWLQANTGHCNLSR